MFIALLLLAIPIVACVYWTTSLAHRALGPDGNVLVAVMISLACWWSVDSLLAFGVAPLLGPLAQIDLIDLRAFGFPPSPAGKFVLYATAHALALAPRVIRGAVRA